MPAQKYMRVRSLQPGYISILTEVAGASVKAKMASQRDPFAVYDYAEALDTLIAILPPEAKKDLTEKLRLDVDRAMEEALAECKTNPYAHPYANTTKCLRRVKEKLDLVLRAVFHVAHKRGLFVVEKEEIFTREG